MGWMGDRVQWMGMGSWNGLSNILIYIQKMINNRHAILTLFLITLASCIDLPLRIGQPTCTALMSSFDPIQLDIVFPLVPGAAPDDNFSIAITYVSSEEIAYEATTAHNSTFRRSIELKPNIVYELCINFDSETASNRQETLYLGYRQAEDFQGLINHIEIPQELAKEDNLKAIYATARRLDGVGKGIAGHQAKERELEDEIVARNIHKTQRIMTLSLAECLVIVLSGVYQICALRKFLIEKNLY